MAVLIAVLLGIDSVGVGMLAVDIGVTVGVDDAIDVETGIVGAGVIVGGFATAEEAVVDVKPRCHAGIVEDVEVVAIFGSCGICGAGVNERRLRRRLFMFCNCPPTSPFSRDITRLSNDDSLLETSEVT